MPGYRLDRLNATYVYSGWGTDEERQNIAPLYIKIMALKANGLTRIDLFWSWISWRIQLLSRWTALMYNYTGEFNDVQNVSEVGMTETKINKDVK